MNKESASFRESFSGTDAWDRVAEVVCERWNFNADIAGYRWEAPEPRGIVLLQHGFGEYAERYVTSYARFIPRLMHAGLSVYAFDLPGHGRSPGPRVVLDSEVAVDVHLAARAALREQPLPVLLFGHSLGGLVTAASAGRDPQGLAGSCFPAPFWVAIIPARRSRSVLHYRGSFPRCR